MIFIPFFIDVLRINKKIIQSFITYLQMLSGKFTFLCCVLDRYPKKIRICKLPKRFVQPVVLPITGTVSVLSVYIHNAFNASQVSLNKFLRRQETPICSKQIIKYNIGHMINMYHTFKNNMKKLVHVLKTYQNEENKFYFKYKLNFYNDQAISSQRSLQFSC